MDWPQIDYVLRIKPISDEKSQRRLWHLYRKKKEKKQAKKGKGIKGRKVDIYI
ncbi:MAG: hypothetical protein Q9M89_01175 [Persephonella sp.]|nr:hypothetical protein [Persephonella sp.]